MLRTRSSHFWMPGVLRIPSGLFARAMPPAKSACFTLWTGHSRWAVTRYRQPPQKNTCITWASPHMFKQRIRIIILHPAVFCSHSIGAGKHLHVLEIEGEV